MANLMDYDADGCRWEKSEWPHFKLPAFLRTGPLPDIIWIRFHTVFCGGMMEDVTGWSATDPNGLARER